MGERPVVAGPCSTAPVVALNTEPWHGQAKTSFVQSNWTVQPAWGQTAEKARNWPRSTWTTRAGTCWAGSVKLAAPPMGTLAAAPIAVPWGTRATGPAVVAGGPALVSGTVDDAPPEVVGLVVGSVVVLVSRLVLVVGLVVGLVLVLMVVVGLVFRLALVLVETLWATEPAELRRCGVWTSRPIPAVSPPNTAPTRAARPAALAF